ncbi:MAG: HD domain-containing protein [Clostridia bacterium]|nr:HD domain-containing protein [Clostridia bacterium]
MTRLFDEIFKMKNLLRRGWILREIPNRTESDAEHCYSMIMLALEIMSKNDLKLDQVKVLKMIAYHELGEIDAGDITIVDNVSKKEKYDKELAGVKRIAKEYDMPEILELWLEFEENKTPEAQFVKKLDKFDCVLQSKVYSEIYDRPEVFEEFKTNGKDYYSEMKKYKR